VYAALLYAARVRGELPVSCWTPSVTAANAPVLISSNRYIMWSTQVSGRPDLAKCARCSARFASMCRTGRPEARLSSVATSPKVTASGPVRV
jgi:hypothetical protein